MEGMVIVHSTKDFFTNEDHTDFMCRCHELDIEGYGKSMEEAYASMRNKISQEVTRHRAMGNLESWLNETGIDWQWSSDMFTGEAEV